MINILEHVMIQIGNFAKQKSVWIPAKYFLVSVINRHFSKLHLENGNAFSLADW
jgi:hypothetical protein